MRITPGELAAIERLADDPSRWPERQTLSLSEAARRLIRAALEHEGIAVTEPSTSG